MKEIKIAFFDIDGTLIDLDRKEISEKMLETLTRLKRRGIILCPATGRAPMTLPHFGEIEFDAFLTFNGSYCFNSEQTIFSNPLASEDVKRLIENAGEIGRPVSIATKNRLAANGADRDLIDYYAMAKLKVEIADDFDMLAREEVFQVMMGCYESEYAHMMKDIGSARITGGTGLSILFRLTAGREKASRKYWNIITLINQKRLRLETEITILRCCRASVRVWPWQMDRIGSKPWRMTCAGMLRRTGFIIIVWDMD